MLSIEQLKIRMDAKTSAKEEFDFKGITNKKYFYQIEKICNQENTEILESRGITKNRNKILNHFIVYLRDYLNLDSLNWSHKNFPNNEDYHKLASLVNKDLARAVFTNYINLDGDRYIDFLETLQVAIDELIDIKEKLYIQNKELELKNQL